MSDNLYNFGKSEIFSASSYIGDKEGYVKWHYWKDESGDWNFIKTTKHLDVAFPEVKNFYIPKEIMDRIIAQTAKERLKET